MPSDSSDRYLLEKARMSAVRSLPNRQRSSATNGSVIFGAALAAYIIAGLSIYVLSDHPWIGLSMANVILSLLLVFLIRSKGRWLFLFYPIVIAGSSQLFLTPFTELGDGPAYSAVVQQYFDTYTGTFYWSSAILQGDLFVVFKNAGFGIVPLYFIPEYLFEAPLAADYYIWQSVWHVGLVALVVMLARLWNALEPRHLAPMALFAVIGPSFFDLGAAPTRHVVTFFGVFLFFISYIALRRAVTPARVAAMAFAVAIILISKAPLMLPALLFVLVDLTVIDRKISKIRFLLIGGAVLLGFAYLGTFLLAQTSQYLGGIAQEDVGSMGFAIRLPVVGPIAKFMFALLAPFPWVKASYFIDQIYGGNWLLFLAHVGSSLCGVYFFILLALRWRVLLSHPSVELRQAVAFGFIMSLSILAGATAFHAYLLIYFPFFAPLFAHPRLGIHPVIPFITVGLIEICMAIAGLS